MASFDTVVDAYAAGRPHYPNALFDALEPLGDRVVIDGGCGTGIASRALVERGARVIAFDVGHAMARYTWTHTPRLWAALVADGSRLPFRDATADVLCFAQSWHWLDPATRIAESARVLAPGGRWAGWWSHARADGQAWFDDYWRLIEGVCHDTNRSQRDVDWGDALQASGLFVVGERISIPWTRSPTIEQWLADESSKSYVAGLRTETRQALLAGIDDVLRREFPSGVMTVPYATWLWTARPTGARAPA